MKPYKIKYTHTHSSSKWRQWLNWVTMVLGIGIAGYAVYVYFVEADQSDAIWHLSEGIIWFLLGYTGIFWKGETFHEVTLKEEGIEYEKKGKNGLLTWSQMQSVNITNNMITIHLQNNQQKELETGYLEYNELQTVKEKLNTLTHSNNVKFSSKY